MKLEIWYDFACPFCYVGEARLQKVFKQLGILPEIEFKSYILEPDNDDEPTSYIDKIKEKYGDDDERALLRFKKVTDLGKSEGIVLDFEKIIDINTSTAHKALQFVDDNGKKLAVFTGIMQAYFQEGKNISDIDVLENILAINHVNTSGLIDYIKSDKADSIIKDNMKEAEDMDLDYIPFFRKNGKESVSGAVSYTKLLNFIALD